MEDNKQIETKKESKVKSFFKKLIFNKYVFSVLIVIILVLGLFIGFGDKFITRSDPTNLVLKDIGELATQCAYVTEVNEVKDTRTLWNVDIPLTTSHLIYSYDFEIKAGFNVDEIKPVVNEEKKTVTIKMPKAEILSNEIKLETFKVYLEDESKFNNIKLNENNEAIIAMQKEAQEHAIRNGILTEAEENGKKVITSLFSNTFDPEEYEYKFKFN
ncbi:DUF4230 domain-containing protein [Floccifex sp.]|uniref:DUF4230 domain-containing protein n=1 Tax=Floccifex sp. TaxID=2815810 RepID=UPI002A751849|nr:DUF4230 domain-containing protein [Floccifex sp.]MDD7281061.1 DUF4230 domain-containing protein [Erysipelotrichaceae bacterium]MDY2957355.1 DUF4230 domain-containing protein [Floccifex sp.]